MLRELGIPGALEALSDRLSGADFTTLWLEVMRRRAGRISPSEIMGRYATDRFLGPATVSFERLRRAEDALLGALPPDFDVVQLSPLVPLGTHSGLGTVDQNRVVSTLRGSEVAADPTNGLALEAAARRSAIKRRAPRSSALVRFAAIQRVVRAQRFDGADSFAHFELFALVSAGRDTGGLSFERDSATEHIGFVADASIASGADRVRIELTHLEAGMAAVRDHVDDGLRGRDDVEAVDRPERVEGRGYYRGFCFKAVAAFGDKALEIADGGVVDWTTKLIADAKERLFITGLGVDRIALGSQAE